MQNKKTHSKNDLSGDFFKGLFRCLSILFKTLAYGIRKTPWKSWELYVYYFTPLIFLGALVYRELHLTYLYKKAPWLENTHFGEQLNMLSPSIYWSICALLLLIPFLFLFGVKAASRFYRYQIALEKMQLGKEGISRPELLHYKDAGDLTTKLYIKSPAVGVDQYSSKKSDLSAAFNENIQEVKATSSPQIIELTLSRSILPEQCKFASLSSQLTAAYTFLVGESNHGTLIQNIRSLPHLLVTGSTGGGKSVFFKQAILGLLQSSSHLQVYLIDLKKGAEVVEFSSFPNVRIAKTESEAVKMLEHLVIEMNRRFTFLEQNRVKSIEPKRDKKDLIVVGIDEASVLFGKSTHKSKNAKLCARARDLIEELMKLSRAAGMHFIVCTQKAVKDAIDTRTLENLVGRISFKMSSHSGSMVALGNSLAYELPQIKGRAIWAAESQFIPVQAPYLESEEIEEEAQYQCQKMLEKEFKNFNPMIEIQFQNNNQMGHFDDLTE